MKRTIFLCGALCLASAKAMAGVSGLIAVPIADVLGHREGLYVYGVAGNESGVSKAVSHAHGLEIGLFDRIELGFDNDTMGETVWNAKAQLWSNEKSAVSVGIWGWKGRQNELFAVGRHDFADFRLHGGAQRVAGKWFGFVGADGGCGKKGMCKEWTWFAEYANGAEPVMNFAIDIPCFFDGFSIFPAYGVPIKNGAGHAWSVTLNYGFKF